MTELQKTDLKTEKNNPMQKRRELQGVVVSDKMEKTCVVRVDRQIRHKLYRKYMTRSKRYHVHDPENQAKNGDLVAIVASRPVSRKKRWALHQVVRKGLDAGVLT